MKNIAIAIIVIALLPLVLRLLVKARLIIPLVYVALASTVFVGWAEANPQLSMAILYILLAGVAVSWLLPLLRRWRENRAINSLIKNQVRQARAKGADSLNIEVHDNIPIVRSS